MEERSMSAFRRVIGWRMRLERSVEGRSEEASTTSTCGRGVGGVGMEEWEQAIDDIMEFGHSGYRNREGGALHSKRGGAR
jgi:hypothetical protein